MITRVAPQRTNHVTGLEPRQVRLTHTAQIDSIIPDCSPCYPEGRRKPRPLHIAPPAKHACAGKPGRRTRRRKRRQKRRIYRFTDKESIRKCWQDAMPIQVRHIYIISKLKLNVIKLTLNVILSVHSLTDCSWQQHVGRLHFGNILTFNLTLTF